MLRDAKKTEISRLKKVYNETKNSYGAGVYYDKKKKRYIKVSASNTPGLSKWMRRIGHKKIRRMLDVPNGGAYRKAYDYKWNIW